MKPHAKALIWAAVIIGAALLGSLSGLSDSASFGVVAGLTGAAWASIHADGSCARGCLQ